jgi:Small, acid-soluble spore proteins, alpha/beta type.
MANKNNSIMVREARKGMDIFKNEVAKELGLTHYDQIDKGELTSRQNGYVGGNMTKKMVYFAEQVINEQGTGVIASVPAIQIPERIRQQNEMFSQTLPQTQYLEH